MYYRISNIMLYLPALLIAVILSNTIVLRLKAPALLPCHNIAYSPDT